MPANGRVRSSQSSVTNAQSCGTRQPAAARICTGDEEDNYFFTTTTNNPVRITLALPGTLVGNTVLLLYDAQTDMRQYIQNCGGLPISGASYAGTCKIPRPGRYVIRIYNERQKDDLNFYTLQVTYQWHPTSQQHFVVC